MKFLQTHKFDISVIAWITVAMLILQENGSTVSYLGMVISHLTITF